MVDQDIKTLQDRVTKLEKLLIMKILGNDTSTNYGLPAQTILYGLQQAGALSLTKNNVRTTINNDVDPDTGQTSSLESEDVSIPHGDKSTITPSAFIVLAWDGAAYQIVANIGETGGVGSLGLANNGTAKAITLDANNPLISITDGIHTSVLTPIGIIVDNGIGIDAGPVVLGAHTLTFVKGILTSLV